MKEINKLRVLSYMLASTLLLSGCSEKSECNIPARHVHKYIRQVNDNISIEKYLDDEHLTVGYYNWTENYIEINKEDEKFYKLLSKKGLFNGVTNWDYLLNEMATHHDYLEFYYHYITIETYTTTDGEGHISIHTRPVTHSGWTDDPDYWHNTGLTRLCHHRYFGYQIMYDNNKYKVVKSEPVDDVREIIDDYQYFSEKCTEIVSQEFEFDKSELKNLSPDDFDVFHGPDLTTKEIYTKSRIK